MRIPLTALALAALLTAIVEPAPAVAAPPATIEECLHRLEEQIAKVDDANLLQDQIDLADAALERMEAGCRDSHFADAASAESDIESLLATNK